MTDFVTLDIDGTLCDTMSRIDTFQDRLDKVTLFGAKASILSPDDVPAEYWVRKLIVLEAIESPDGEMYTVALGYRPPVQSSASAWPHVHIRDEWTVNPVGVETRIYDRSGQPTRQTLNVRSFLTDDESAQMNREAAWPDPQ